MEKKLTSSWLWFCQLELLFYYLCNDNGHEDQLLEEEEEYIRAETKSVKGKVKENGTDQSEIWNGGLYR